MWRFAVCDFVRSKCWYRILLLMCCGMLVEKVAEASQQDGSISRVTIPMDPAAAEVFPSAQLSPECAIIRIEGLGPLDGDYALVNELTEMNGAPAWIGTSAGTRHWLLSWQDDVRVWAIGVHGLSIPVFRAFCEGGFSNVPPSTSSRWQMYSEGASAFKQVENVVSIACPACTAVAISMLPGTLSACEGSYRLRTANHKAGFLSWSHVHDERCEMLHDRAGHAWVTLANPPATDGSYTAYGLPRGEYWVLHAEAGGATGSAGDGANVVCTSAGRTTRLVFTLIQLRAGIDSPQANYNSRDADSYVPSSDDVRLVSTQDGSVISATCSSIHLRLSRPEEMRQPDRHESNVSGTHLADENSCGTALCVKITVNEVEVMTTSLERMAIQGGRLSLHGLEGTNILEVCLFNQDKGGTWENRFEQMSHGCIARAALTLEMFSAETQMVQRRSTGETMLTPSVMSSGIKAENNRAESIRVLFLVDLDVVDGFKLSTLHLINHLPDTFQASTLDLSCASGDLPMQDILTKEVGEVERICVIFWKKTWEAAVRKHGTMSSFLHAVFSKATTWEDVVSDYPDVAQALGDLYRHLIGFDALVMSNGGKDTDAYLLHLARVAGVQTRMVNLGAITGGYMSLLFSGATSLIGPSQYVAHNPAVATNAGGLPVKVCHPVMDAARVLKAAESCRKIEGGSNINMGPQRSNTDELGISRVELEGSGSDDIQPATFIMVGRVATYKTPGMFVRAMAVLQRRRRADGKKRGRRTQGVVVGRGPLQDHMETLTRDLNASVRFTGFLSIDNVPCEVQRATALVVPSISAETFGMVGPEAMLLGVPLVTFGFGGTGELVRHLENGMVVAQPTPKALADALEMLANDSGLRDRLGAQARLDATRALSLTELVACHADELRIRQ